jgi:hypothetical protein
LLETAQCNALLALFEPMKCGDGQADFSGKFGICHPAALLAEKSAELSFKRVTHGMILADKSFHLRNN